VFVKGPLFDDGPQKGMVMDFGLLSKIVKEEILDRFDHTNLNDYWENPTAENMAELIYLTLLTKIPDLWCIKLWESETSFVMYSEHP
jgi:6-pyruvoyltetrahydropterin/6-carboxytetrahydropterin synthase